MIIQSGNNPWRKSSDASASKTPITVLLGDKHRIFREGVRALLASEPDITVIAEAQSGQQALEMGVSLRPSVLLIDFNMPALNVFEVARRLQQEAREVKILLLSDDMEERDMLQLFSLGAKGFLLKRDDSKTVMEAIRDIHIGNTFFSPFFEKHLRATDWETKVLAARNKKNLTHLTAREMEILPLIAEGKANKQIGALLTISIKTVEKHRDRLMKKLEIHDTAGLTRYSLKAGITEG